MNANVGKIDKIIRILVGIVFGLLYFTKIISGTWGIVLLIAGIILILTAFVGRCGLYYPFGINTCSTKSE